MISRLTASAALFAILATASLTFGAEEQQNHLATAGSDIATAPMQIIQLPPVSIVGHRAH